MLKGRQEEQSLCTFPLNTINIPSDMLIKNYDFITSTLHYQISVGVWLLIPRYFSSQHALIPYPMFIDFARNFNPIRHNLSNISFSDMFAFKMHQKGVLNGCKLLNFMKKNQSFAKKIHPIRLFRLTCSLILRKFPPNTTIPYHMFIDP